MMQTRRDMIRWGLVGLGSLAIGCFDDKNGAAVEGTNGETLVRLDPPAELVDNPWTAKVGQVVLKSMSDSEKQQAFRQLLESAPKTGPKFAAFLKSRHSADLAAGRVRRVEGWLLSETEASFYAYVADGDASAADMPAKPNKSAGKPESKQRQKAARGRKKTSKKDKSVRPKKTTRVKTPTKGKSGASSQGKK